MNDQHARNREAMARRLHFYLESAIVTGSIAHSPEWLAGVIRRLAEFDSPDVKMFFRSIEKGAGEHEASDETWLRVADLLEASAPMEVPDKPSVSPGLAHRYWQQVQAVVDADRGGTQGQACHPQCACGRDPMVGRKVCWLCACGGPPTPPEGWVTDEGLRDWLDQNGDGRG